MTDIINLCRSSLLKYWEDNYMYIEDGKCITLGSPLGSVNMKQISEEQDIYPAYFRLYLYKNELRKYEVRIDAYTQAGVITCEGDEFMLSPTDDAFDKYGAYFPVLYANILSLPKL